jgi:hypothetical protein
MSIYFLTAHKSTQFIDDSNPPSPGNSVKEGHYDLYDEIIFGKRITQNEISLMVQNHQWTSGTVYDMYDDTTPDLADKKFYTVTQEGSDYYVFKCLNNNNGAQSVDQPLRAETSPDDEFYRTSDGYQWKYMYKIPLTEYRQFATTNYVPIIIDGEVEDNAVNGAIETIVIDAGGDGYNSYAYGTIKEAAVAGNTRIFSIQSDSSTDVLVFDIAGLSGAFNVGVDIEVLYDGELIGIGEVYSESDTTIRIIGYTGQNVTTAGIITSSTPFVVRQYVNEIQVAEATLAAVSRVAFPTLSANTDFYKNNSIYIRSGKGAGQLRTISEYIVTGDERRILVDEAFSTIPDTTSRFEISPRVVINGDGSGAQAIAKVATTANTVSEIEILNRGSNYTYANVSIIANTGIIGDTSSSGAVVRAIIPPPGGHGSNLARELYCSRMGIGMVFNQDEALTIPTANDYRKIGILKDPLFANTSILLDTAATDFTAGEPIGQANTGAIGIVTGRTGNLLTLTDVRGFLETGSNTVNYITGLESGQTAAVESIDRTFNTFDQRHIFQVEISNPGTSGTGFIEDEKVTQAETGAEGYIHESNNAVKLNIDSGYAIANYIEGERIVQNDTAAEAVIASINVNDSYLILKDVSGTFEQGDQYTNTIVGEISQYESVVTSVTTDALILALVNVTGNFAITDTSTNDINTFIGEDSGAEAIIYGRDYTRNYLVDNSGEFVYIENTIPIERASDQSERIKIIIEF